MKLFVKNVKMEMKIEKAIAKLKQSKAHCPDSIINEYFIEYKHYLLPILHTMFNCVLFTDWRRTYC